MPMPKTRYPNGISIHLNSVTLLIADDVTVNSQRDAWSLCRSCFCTTAGVAPSASRALVAPWRAAWNRRVECPTSPTAGEAAFHAACLLRMDARDG